MIKSKFQTAQWLLNKIKHAEDMLQRHQQLFELDLYIVGEVFAIEEMFNEIDMSIKKTGTICPDLNFFGYEETQEHYQVHRLMSISDKEANEKSWRYRSKNIGDLNRYLTLFVNFHEHVYFNRIEVGTGSLSSEFLLELNALSKSLMVEEESKAA